jgi:2-polyprenyl-6-methoxyphenol hydroxylase-like FAD-dependent oxidoreductase
VKVIVIGAGPAGLTLAAALARRGHDVLSTDRDGGPTPDGTWHRIGVMQFDQAHGFRSQVPELLHAEWPEAYETWIQLGAEPVVVELPGGEMAVAVRSRRIAYERALRSAAQRVPRLTLTTGVVDGFVEGFVDGERSVRGVEAGGRTIVGDLVIDASGRGLAGSTGAIELDGICGISYVGRMYRLHRDAEPGPLTSAISWGGTFDGYQAIVFPHERRHMSAVFVRPTTDRDLGQLRHADAFHAASMEIPGMREWTRPETATPMSDVLLGGRPRNIYRSQRNLRGLVAVGDCVATTTPTAGRGIAMASMQIRALLRLLDTGTDPRMIAEPFGAWCDAQIRPWVEEHIARDRETGRRLGGDDLDLDLPLTTTAIVDAAQVEPRITPHLAGYLGMNALPVSLAPAEPLARAVYQSGWRPPFADGPTRDELVASIARGRGVDGTGLAS